MRTEIIKNRFTEKILQLTGIRVAPGDMKLNIGGDYVALTIWDKPVKTVSYRYIYDPASTDHLIFKLMSPVKAFREALIEAQIYRLSGFVPSWAAEITDALLQQNISPRLLHSLEFRIVNNGYLGNAHAHTHEGHYDYPYLALEINNNKGFRFSSLLNVYDNEDPLDIEFLKENLFIAIIEKSLTQPGLFR